MSWREECTISSS